MEGDFIFGSGIIGYFAKSIFPNFTLIPFKRSRYFCFEIPWADNFIRIDKTVDKYMSSYIQNGSPIWIYKTPFSFRGQLIYDSFGDIASEYLSKVYGESSPLIEKLLKTTFSTYPVSAISLHNMFNDKFREEISRNVSLGELIDIDLSCRKFRLRNSHTGKITIHDYKNIISTIPLDALCKYCNIEKALVSKPVCYYVIETNSINLEGAQQCYIADKDILFFKVSNLGDNKYLFWTIDVIEDAYMYFGRFLNYNIDILEAHRIDGAIPIGDPPDLKHLSDNGIVCVGSNAQWDDQMDLGSCLKRILRFQEGMSE